MQPLPYLRNRAKWSAAYLSAFWGEVWQKGHGFVVELLKFLKLLANDRQVDDIQAADLSHAIALKRSAKRRIF